MFAKAKEPAKAKAAPTVRKAPPASSTRLETGNHWRQLALGIHERLAVTAPGDPYEREADRVAERVMHMSDRSFTRNSPLAPPAVPDVLTSPGFPLDSVTRTFMEPRFGYDLSGVRIHADAEAAESASRVNALAFTVGRHIVFGRDRYAPASSVGRRLLAHEIAHVLQPAADTRIAREPDDKKEQDQPAPAPTTTAGGHTAAPSGTAPCPDAPPRNVVVLGCTAAPSPTPLKTEKAVLPTADPHPYGGDADRAKFAKELAQCRAEREVKDEIEKRYRADVAAAKKKATEESKADTEAAIQAATEGLDPKDKRSISRAKADAAAAAKKEAAKKIEAAGAAIKKQDVAAVTAELAAKYEAELSADYDATIAGALGRYGRGWLQTMQSALDKERKRILTEKSARPKVPKGETPPPAKSPDVIAAEVEAEMVEVRCDQKGWALDQLEGISRAWAVGRREQVDFRTIPQKASYLKDFKPSYEVPSGDLVQIPAALKEDPNKELVGVSPELADFLTQLAADPNTPAFTASNYGGHGGGSWLGKGFSTDISLKGPKDQRGFWRHSTAVQLLLAVDATAKKLGARWRVLYNDFGVAQEVNRITGNRNVEFMGQSGGGNLNWHGPHPLILHFHLDLEIPQKKSAAGTQPEKSE